MKLSKKIISPVAIILVAILTFAGSYTSVEASQRLETTTTLTQSEITKDVSDFLGNYTMIGSDGSVTTITSEQMSQIMSQGSEVVGKAVVKEVAKQHLSRETLIKLETSIYEIIDMTMADSDLTEAEMALLKSSVASIVEQNVLEITSEYYEVSERNVSILETSINEKLKVIEEVLAGYDKRLVELQSNLDTLLTDVQEAEKKEDLSKEKIDELQKQIEDVTSQLSNMQMKYESYAISSGSVSLIMDGIYSENKEMLDYATKQALANSEAATKEKIEKLNALIGEWNSNVTLSQAVADAQEAIASNAADLEGKLKNLQTIFEMEMMSNKNLTSTDIANMQSTINTLQTAIENMSREDVSTLYVEKNQFEQKLAENANADASTKTALLTEINRIDAKIKALAGLENVQDELDSLVADASEELSQIFDTKIQTLQTQMTNSISELESALGEWTEDTTIAEYLIAARTAIVNNDTNQTAQINAAKTALELQIANNKEVITDEARAELNAAVAVLNSAIAGETSDREQALLTLENMINQTNTDLTGVMDQKVSTLTQTLNDSVSSINSNIHSLSNTLGTWDGTGTIAAAVKEAQETSSLLGSQLQTTNTELQATQNSLTNTNTLLEKLKGVVASDSELSMSYTGTLVSRMAVSEGLINSMQSELSTATSDIRNLENTVAQLQTAVNANADAIAVLQSLLGDQVIFSVVDGTLYITTK